MSLGGYQSPAVRACLPKRPSPLPLRVSTDHSANCWTRLLCNRISQPQYASVQRERHRVRRGQTRKQSPTDDPVNKSKEDRARSSAPAATWNELQAVRLPAEKADPPADLRQVPGPPR